MWLTSDLVSNVTQCHFCCILFTRGQPLRPAHAWAEYLCGYLLKHPGVEPSNTYALRTSEGAVGSRKWVLCWGPTSGERVCSWVSGQVNWVEKIQMVHSFSNLVNTSAHTRVVRRELVPLQNYTYCSGALMLKSFWQPLQCSNWNAWEQKNCFLLLENSGGNYKSGISEKMQHILRLLKCQTSGHQFIWLILQGYK